MQMPRRGQPVAGVVADAADNRGGLSDEPGDLPSGGLHQPLD
jgi:hypothetical protein